MKDTANLVEPATPPSSSGMSAEVVDVLLADLAAVADRLIADSAAAQRELDERNDENERWLTQGDPPVGFGSSAHPGRALTSMRLEHAIEGARVLRQSSRRIVAWWADLVTYAVSSTAAGRSINPVRAAGADPSAYFGEEDLHHLPGPPDDARELAELAVGLFADRASGPSVLAGGAPLGAGEVAARAGLTLRRSSRGDLVVVDDTSPDARLRRMWGDRWVAYQMPALPSANALAAALTAAGMPSPVVEEIRSATEAVDHVLGVAVRLARSEDSDASFGGLLSAAEEVKLWKQVERSTDVLAAYARTLTDHLPAIRAADRP